MRGTVVVSAKKQGKFKAVFIALKGEAVSVFGAEQRCALRCWKFVVVERRSPTRRSTPTGQLVLEKIEIHTRDVESCSN